MVHGGAHRSALCCEGTNACIYLSARAHVWGVGVHCRAYTLSPSITEERKGVDGFVQEHVKARRGWMRKGTINNLFKSLLFGDWIRKSFIQLFLFLLFLAYRFQNSLFPFRFLFGWRRLFRVGFWFWVRIVPVFLYGLLCILSLISKANM